MIPLRLINPIQTDAFRDLNIRKRKNDVIDSLIIAELLRFGKFSSCSVPDEQTVALKNLSRFHSYLADACSTLKTKAIALPDQVFPEYQSLFADTFGVTSRELLLKYTVPEEFREIPTAKLAKFITTASKGRLGKAKAETIKSAAQNSFGINYAVASFAFELRMLVEQIGFVEKQLDALDKRIAKILSASPFSAITAVSGFGSVLAASVIGEIGDINRFDAPKNCSHIAA
jgi:transposase